MKYTLLEMTQRILESMESDEVSTISETPESQSVANIIKESYFGIIGEMAPSDTVGLFKLDASGDNTKPVLMSIPSTVSKIEWVKYNIEDAGPDTEWYYMRQVDLEEFISSQSSYELSDANVDSMTIPVNSQNFTFKFYNDRDPSFYVVIDEQFLVFDAYNSAVDSTLQQSKTLCKGLLVPAFLMQDNFVPDLDARMFQLLLQEAKSVAFVELKQAPNPKAEQKARRNHILGQKIKDDNQPGYSNQLHVSFGRKGSFSQIKRDMRNGR
ncbi:MAG: hypothetical protein AB7W16_15570 [Candidatus Obscuribacterales bacterium]